MRKLSIGLCLLVMVFVSSLAAAPYSLDQLQGAWWSDPNNTTADFAIDGDTVWLEFDSVYHPCKIQGDMLVFDLGPEHGKVENRIISVEGDRMVMESPATKERVVLTRVKS